MGVTRVILPKIGITMDEGKVVAWRKREGDPVEAGEILFEVETDKATMEVPSPAFGVVRKVLVGEGASAPVATVVALIADTPDEPLGELAPSVGAERVRSSPAARKRAQELGIEIEQVKGTGPDGRVTLEDIDAAAGVAAARGSGGGLAPRLMSGERRVPLTRMRKAIAEAMTRSAQVPQFQVSRDVDMTAADELRRGAGVSYTDVLVAACAQALRKHERLRSRFDGDALVVSDAVNVGVAVALEDGLVVTVVRDADRKDLHDLAAERERLEQGARAGRLPADALTGAVFSVSNLGTLGVDRFQALVDTPQAAILAVGRVSAEKRLVLTLSVDHRVADGADAARFLADVAVSLESGGSASG